MAVLKVRSGGAWVEVPVGVSDHGNMAGLGDHDHPLYPRLASVEAITGLWNFSASGGGGVTDYDLSVGDVVTPDYGIIRIGNSIIGRTSYNVGGCDLDGALVWRNVGGPVTGQIEFALLESGGQAIRFALPKSGVGNATYNPRSMLIAGPAVLDDDIVTVAYWRTNNNIFHNIDCDTSGVGADLGVQNDLEVEGIIYADNLQESTPGVGMTVGANLLPDGDAIRNLGHAASKWNFAYISNLIVTNLRSHLIPDLTAQYDLGTNLVRLRNAFFSGDVTLGGDVMADDVVATGALSTRGQVVPHEILVSVFWSSNTFGDPDFPDEDATNTIDLRFRVPQWWDGSSDIVIRTCWLAHATGLVDLESLIFRIPDSDESASVSISGWTNRNLTWSAAFSYKQLDITLDAADLNAAGDWIAISFRRNVGDANANIVRLTGGVEAYVDN